jgi:phage shock protein PspC (stress-responsive transcriptional regulator)
MTDKPPKRLRKSKEKVIAGVCGGIADWLGWDPTVVRVGYVLVSLVSAAFPGILVYLLFWAIMPPPLESPAS